jgi:hypothetical protein
MIATKKNIIFKGYGYFKLGCINVPTSPIRAKNNYEVHEEKFSRNWYKAFR